MRNISTTGNLPGRQFVIHPRRYQVQIKHPLSSFRTNPQIYIPPLNLKKHPTSHSFIFDKSQRIQKPQTSTFRQQDSNKLTQRTQCDKYTHQIFTQRKGRQQLLLKDIKQLQLQNDKLRTQLAEHKNSSKSQIQRLKQQNHRLQCQKIQLSIKLQQFQRKPKHYYQNSKQITLYKQIIQKLQRRIELLSKQSKALIDSLNIKANKLIQAENVFRSYDILKNNMIQLQRMLIDDNNEWVKFKRQWIKQKDGYISIINKLQSQLIKIKQ